MLRAYFDDSGTHSGSPVTGMGGLVGTIPQWEHFEQQWGEKLKNPVPGKPPLKAFHLSHCAALRGEFQNYGRAESDLVTAEFRRIIASSGLVSTASVIDRVAWDELILGPIREVLGSALEPCFGNCIDESMRIAKIQENPGNHKIAIVFDQGIKSGRLQHMADLYMRHVGGNPWITSITFAKVQDVLPLQGADMAATESYWHAQKWLEAGDAAQARVHFQDYLKTVRGEGLIIDREAILGEVARRGPDGRVLERLS